MCQFRHTDNSISIIFKCKDKKAHENQLGAHNNCSNHVPWIAISINRIRRGEGFLSPRLCFVFLFHWTEAVQPSLCMRVSMQNYSKSICNFIGCRKLLKIMQVNVHWIESQNLLWYTHTLTFDSMKKGKKWYSDFWRSSRKRKRNMFSLRMYSNFDTLCTDGVYHFGLKRNYWSKHWIETHFIRKATGTSTRYSNIWNLIIQMVLSICYYSHKEFQMTQQFVVAELLMFCMETSLVPVDYSNKQFN